MAETAALPGCLLHWAARENRADLVREALQIGEPIDALVPRNCKPPTGLADSRADSTPLAPATSADPPVDSDALETALHAAVRTASIDTARALLAAGAAVNVQDEDGLTPIACAQKAAETGEGRILMAFISELCQRAGKNDAVGVKLLVQAGLSPDQIDSEATANTPLHWAASFGAADATIALLQVGASVGAVNRQDATPLCDAVRNASEECVAILVDAGADVDKARPLAQHDAILELLGNPRPPQDREQAYDLPDPQTEGQSDQPDNDQPVSVGQSSIESNLAGPRSLDETCYPPDQPYAFSRDPQVAARSHDARVAALGGAQELPSWAECLWPKPRRVCFDPAKEFTCPRRISIQVEHDQIAVAKTLASWLRALAYIERVDVQVRQHWEPDDEVTQIHLVVDDSATFQMKTEAYRLIVGTKNIDLIGSDPAGLFYASCTLEQLIRLRCDNVDLGHSSDSLLTIPCGSIADSPSLTKRGVMLDVSSTRIPSLKNLKVLVLQLARLKFNQFQLRMENSFAFIGHEVVWEHSGALTAEQIMELDAFCSQHFIELVPHQNSFSDLSAWLTVSAYRHLAECPDKAKQLAEDNDPFDDRSLSLCPAEDSLRFLDGLYTQMLPCFSSNQVHVGFAESSDIGTGRTSGPKTALTLTFLQQVSSLAAHHAKRTVQFWSGALGGPDIEFLPGDLPPRAVAMECGSERNYPFNERCLILARLGVPFYVCPSSGGQNSFGGRLSNSVETIKSAAKAAVRYSGVGLLLTDSGESGHLQPLVVSYPSYLAAAGAAWNANEALCASESDLALISRLLDCHFFGDGDEGGLLGSVLCMYGDLHLLAEGKEGIWDSKAGDTNNESRLFRLLVYGKDRPSDEGLQVSGLRKAQRRVEKSLDIVNGYQGKATNLDVLELQLVGELLRLACRIGILLCLSNDVDDSDETKIALSQLSGATRSDIVNRMLQVLQLYRVCWDQRNLPQGFTQSVAYLEKALTDMSHGLPQMGEFIKARQQLGWVMPPP